MLAVVSPAKALNFDPFEPSVPVSHPRLLDGAAEIGDVAKKRSRSEFKKLMKLSDALADLTYERFQAFDATDEELMNAGQHAFGRVAQTEDMQEGPRAFLEKRAPQWKGR